MQLSLPYSPAAAQANRVTGSFHAELPDLLTWGKEVHLSNSAGILHTGS